MQKIRATISLKEVGILKRVDDILTEQFQDAGKIGYVAWCIGLYFLVMPFDLIVIGSIGSLLKVIALLPVGAIILNYDKCTFNSMEALPVVLYAIYKQLSTVYTVFPTFTFQETAKVASNAALVFILGGLYCLNSKEIKLFKFSLFIGCLITIGLLIIFADFSAGGRLTIRTAANEVDQNYLIGYLIYIIPFSIEQLFTKRRYLSFAPVVAVYVIVIMAGSRGGLIAALVATVISISGMLFENKGHLGNHAAPIILAGLGAALGLMLVMQYLNPDVLERFSPDYVEENGTTGRKDIWIYLIHLFLQSTPLREVFGYGAGVTSFVNRMNTRMAGHVAHNLWVDELVTGGVIGLFLLLLIHAVFMYTAINCRDTFTTAALMGFLIMCLNLSITSYKPMWNCMILIMLINKNRKKRLQLGVAQNENTT